MIRRLSVTVSGLEIARRATTRFRRGARADEARPGGAARSGYPRMMRSNDRASASTVGPRVEDSPGPRTPGHATRPPSCALLPRWVRSRRRGSRPLLRRCASTLPWMSHSDDRNRDDHRPSSADGHSSASVVDAGRRRGHAGERDTSQDGHGDPTVARRFRIPRRARRSSIGTKR